uniref:PHB domain-containing protein n=1 Tax=Heterorhabditis bacteriophora TaxID=37862 RepID=A0A1I7XP84_HETBA
MSIIRSTRLLDSFGRTCLLPLSIASCRKAHARNTFINFVPQQEAWVIERMGKFYKILEPGLNILIPVIDRIKFVQSLKEIAIEIPQQGAITLDNVQLQLDGVLYLRIFNPYKASYGVDDPEFAVTQLAQTTMRSEVVGKISLDTVFKEREQLNENIVTAINRAAEPWGITCMRYEIRDMHMPSKIQEAMQMQVEAERRKRAAILESEGHREAAINRAEGEKRAAILASEAAETEQAVNVARGQAEALKVNAEARAQAIERVATALSQKGADGAASLTIAEQYVKAFGQLAKESNTVVLPANLAEPGSMVAQALTLYGSITKRSEKL